jgi:RNA polymerase-binding protein DksA
MMGALSETQKQHLEQKLHARRATLREEIREALLTSSEERHRELAGMVHDAADDSVADLLTDVNLKGMDRDARELAAVNAALDRLARGTLDVCLDCGGDIGFPRLDAQPTASRCIECETRHEKQYAHERGPTL